MALTTEIILTLQQLEGIGNKTIFKIAESTPTQIDSLESLCSFWPTLKGKKLEAIDAEDLTTANNAAKRIMATAHEEGVGILSYWEADYPEILKSCTNEQGKLDAPIVLYYRGDINALKLPGVAVIGTREPTSNGVKAGLFFAGEFAKKGYNIVSGLAIGCDTTGHRGALDAGGVTTAFLANGLDWDSIYPKDNLDLAKEIVTKGGLLLSEYTIGQSCGRYGLVARDRLQAGLSLGTIVVQTGINGGTMHAVNATLASNKPLFAVEYKSPADFTHEKVQGNIMLIRDKGAHPLRSNELEAAFSILQKPKTTTQPPKTLFDL